MASSATDTIAVPPARAGHRTNFDDEWVSPLFGDEEDVFPMTYPEEIRTPARGESRAGQISTDNTGVASNESVPELPYSQTPTTTPGTSSTDGQSPTLTDSPESSTDPGPVGNRRRITGKRAPEGYYAVACEAQPAFKKRKGNCKILERRGFDRHIDRDIEEAKRVTDRLHHTIRRCLAKLLKADEPTMNKEARRKRAAETWSNASARDRVALIQKVLMDPDLSNEEKELLEHHQFKGVAAKERDAFLKAKAVMCTYFDPWLQIRSDELDHLDQEQLTAAVRKLPATNEKVTKLKELIGELVKTRQADKFSWSLEICMDTYRSSYADTKTIKLHVHLVLEVRDGKFMRFNNVKLALRVGSMSPGHVKGMQDPQTSNKTKCAAAMHYYVQMPKVGLVGGDTNHRAYTQFLVNPRWITGYIQSQKLSLETAKKVILFYCNV